MGAAHAQSPGPQSPGPKPDGPRHAIMACQADAKTLCAGKEGREARQCLGQNAAKLSAVCKDAIVQAWAHPHRHHGWEGRGPMTDRMMSPERKAVREAVRKACEPDMKSLCAGKEGREAMMCMMQNRDKISAACKDAMTKARPMMRRRGPGGPPPTPPQQ